MKKILKNIISTVLLVLIAFLGFYFYKSKISVVDYKKYKYYDEAYIGKYSGKILKNYDEYKEFVGDQEILLNKKDFEKKHYAIIFVFDSCSSEYLGIKRVSYGNSKSNESISIQVKVKELEGNKCNNQKIVLVPISKDKSINQDRVKYSFVSF